MYLSYDAPSANTVLMILRDYARRNGRLPDTIVPDNGCFGSGRSIYRSRALEDVLAGRKSRTVSQGSGT